jgi:hypothetical protein
MGTNERRLDMLEKRAREAVSEIAERDARLIAAIWNARQAKGRELWFHLRIGGAIPADHPWLVFAASKSARSTCARSIAIQMQRLNRLSCRSAVGQTRRS